MKRQTKHRVIIALIVALIAVIIYWIITYPRQKYTKISGLTNISFAPPMTNCSCSSGQYCGPDKQCINGDIPPVFTFTFDTDLDPDVVNGSNAFVFDFTPTTVTPESNAILASLKNMPFTPLNITQSTPTIASNTMPDINAKYLPGIFTIYTTIDGSGEMWFTTPPAPPASSSSAGSNSTGSNST